MELAVIGNEDFVLGFRLVGIRKTFVVPDEDLEVKISEVMEDKDIGVLILHAQSLERVSSVFRKKLIDSPKPVVISVGEEEEEDLRGKVKRAIGVDLYRAG
ncbi:MAG: V-type ATP synthase subunit F [Thermoplasmata archaeon]